VPDRILVVEDEKKVAAVICRGLEEESYHVDVVHDGEVALQQAMTAGYDLLILDVMLPQKSGIEILRQVRSHGQSTPALILTAKTSLEDKVSGLDSGADDYLGKPFALAELLARVRSLLRRGGREKTHVLALGDLTLDPLTRHARCQGRSVDLTAREYALLEYFLRNKDCVLSRALIAEHIWHYSFDPGTNIIDVYVNHLRKKIEQGFNRKLIHSVRGVGYIMKEE
jgi:DNA-binding response OmpR family regulator